MTNYVKEKILSPLKYLTYGELYCLSCPKFLGLIILKLSGEYEFIMMS